MQRLGKETCLKGGAVHARRVCLLGATGTIGRATARALAARGHEVVCLVRAGSACPPGLSARLVDVADPESLAREGFRGERFDALISCMASRTGAPRDAWAVDFQAHVHALQAARLSGVEHFVLLSAICVQKPLLAFQRAKLAFEKNLAESGMPFTIVRPTAFFKSLCGQIGRVRRGKPFLLFGDGRLTACKPLSDHDLAEYLVDCLEVPARRNCVLPIGGPGEAITPLQQGQHLFALLGRRPHFRHVPIRLLDAVIGISQAVGRVAPSVAGKAELARIGRYYATESMLLWDSQRACYDAAATPSTGRETLFEFYASLVAGKAELERGAHSVF